MPTTTNITISDVERIAAMADPVLRNLQITQCYHELSLVLAERTNWNANWCTFATWASKQAGQTIRKEDLGRTLGELLGSEAAADKAVHDLAEVAQRLGASLSTPGVLESIWKAYNPQAAFERSSAAVARGNLKVFQEIAREFARFYADCLVDSVFDGENITRFTQQLHSGDPPDGQRYLRQAFQHYYRALFEEDEKERVELLLLANLEIGFHEQTRLQPDINEALTGVIISPQAFAQSLLEVLRPGAGWYSKLVWRILRWLGRMADFDKAIEIYVAGAQRQAQFIFTKTMMTIELPHQIRLKLGEDLSERFPAMLQQISNPDLKSLLARIDPTPDSLSESGTDYWGDLQDRIHFIADMFRCYAISSALHESPFIEDQIAALKQGRLPNGRL